MLLAPPLCWSCGAPARRGRSLCAECRRTLRFLGPEPVVLSGLTVWAPLAYEGPARDLVRALKFRAALRLADEMAALMIANVPPELLHDTLVPVPAHPAQLRRRGFGQATALAAAIHLRTELTLTECLVREGPDLRQVGRGRGARLAGPAGSIRVTGRRAPESGAPESGAPESRAPESHAPRRVTLVDDVVTTGATVAACAAALRAAGAREVSAIAFARTPGR